MFLLSSLRYLGSFQLQEEARLKPWGGRVGKWGRAEVLTVDEPDRGPGDGEEEPGAHVHLDQHCRQGEEEQDDQQAAQNPHRLGDAVWKGGGQSGHRWAQARQGEEGEEFHPRTGQRGLGRDAEGGKGGQEDSPQGPRWSCLSKGGEDLGGGPGAEPGGGLSPLVQEGVEECEEQQGQL